MKTTLLAFLVSFSAMASECYVRTADLVTNEVSLAKELCINGVDLKLEVFGNSKATIKYTLDGVEANKEVRLSNPIERRDGKVLFLVFGLQSDFEGGGCSESTEASIDASLVMNKDGSGAVVEEIKGSVSTSYDNCHSGMDEIQSIPYSKI